MQSEKRHCLNFFTPFCPAVGGLSENISYFCITMDIYDVKILSDRTEGTMRKIAVATCRAVCSVQINIILESDVIRSVAFEGGCQGNLLGISALCQGMKVADAIARLRGIDCGGKRTSCPDQLARALAHALETA